MTNNDILRRLRYTFDFDDTTMITIFKLGELDVTRAQISDWLKKEDNPAFIELNDSLLAVFLNGLITQKRGKKEGVKPRVEEKLTNNIIFMKLKIALNLQAEDIIDVLRLEDLFISKHELSAFFRKPGHKHYRVCQEQILRVFLKGIQQKYCDNKS